jgi:flagellar hook-associated protein 1 FlgK
VTNFPQSPAPTAPIFATVDGLDFSNPAGTPSPGDRFLIKPFSSAADNITSVFSTPRSLAVASPVAGNMATKNTGSLQQVSLSARNNPPTAVPVTLTFTGPNSYTRSDELPTADTTVFAYTPGQAIEATYPDLPPTDPLTFSQPLQDWTVTLQGSPQAGDSYTVQANTYSKLNAGNATAMMALRDKALFDGSALTDGYASLISQIGIRAQSANYAADVSATIAANVEKDRTGLSGVNLDEEAAKLLQFQQAYQASAKMMQIAQSVFQTLMQQLGG